MRSSWRLLTVILLLATVLAACGGSPAPTTPTVTVQSPSPAGGTPAAAASIAPSPSSGQTQPSAAPTEQPPSQATAAPTQPAPEATQPALPTAEATTAPSPQPAETAAPEPTASTPAPGSSAAYTGTVTARGGQAVAGALVYIDDVMGKAGPDGRFSVQAPEGAKQLTVMVPGYKKYTAELSAQDVGQVPLEPFVVKGVYVSGVGDMSVRERFYKLLDTTELNAIVINVKNDDGKVWTSQVPLAQQTGASYKDFYLKDFVKEAHSRGIYVIGRFTTFRDPNLATARPDLAVRTTSGGVWGDNKGNKWADPFNKQVWQYYGDLLEEIASSGIDEIQFDYVRFPVDGNFDIIKYQTPSTHINRPDTITAFLKYATERMRRHKVFISADTYGLTVWSNQEQGTGQILERMAPYLDYYSPMIYPDHFAAGTGGYSIPTQHSYEIISESVRRARARLKGTPVLVRPYLSAFRDTQFGQPFGLKQFLQQKQGAEDAGAEGWLYWNAALTYPDGLFRKE